MTALKITVIGAGIAGLTAAHHLQRLGHQVKVLEAKPHVGGRMITIHWQGFRLDPGASFLTSKDAYLLRLVDELGMTSQVVPFRKDDSGFHVDIVRDGVPHNVDFMSLSSYLGWKGVSPAARLSMVKLLPHILRMRRADPFRPECAPGNDDETMEQFFRRAVHPEMFDYWVEPTMDVMSSYLPGDYSAKMLLLSYAGYLSTRTLSFRDGIGSLPQALASRLDVECGARVRRIEQEPGGSGVRLDYIGNGQERTLASDRVVVAVTGDAVLDLFDDPLPAWQRFFPHVHYTSSAKLFFRLEGDDPVLEKGGAFFPRVEPWKAAVLGWQRKPDGRVQGMGALRAGIYDPAMSDDDFTRTVLDELLRFEPRLAGCVRETMVFRWDRKVPTFPPGYLPALKAFKEDPQEGPVYFCGDYLIMGSAGSALASGWQCAERLLSQAV